MKRLLKSALAIMMAFTAIPACASPDGSAAPDGSVTGIATFTADGVNLRRQPSASSPYLIYMSGGELYFDPANIMWSNELGNGVNINGRQVLPDHTKLQGHKGESYAVTASVDDWVRLLYLGHDVWTMKKFVKIDDLSPLSPSMTFSFGGDYNALNLTGTEEGAPALLYQEAGMDEDQGFFIGHVEGNTIVFDYFRPFELVKVNNLEVPRFAKSSDGDWETLRIGSKNLLKGVDYDVPDVKSFTPQQIKDLTRGLSKLDSPLRIINTPLGAKSL